MDIVFQSSNKILLKYNILFFIWIPIFSFHKGSSSRRPGGPSIVTADVEIDPTVGSNTSVNIIKEPDTPELVDTVESSV